MPCVGLAPEWMSEKALTIGMYFVASGVPVIFYSEQSPVGSSKVVKNIMENTFTDIFKAGFYFENNPMKIVNKTISEVIGTEPIGLGVYDAPTTNMTSKNLHFVWSLQRALKVERNQVMVM